MKSDNLPHRVELWSQNGQKLEETLSACGSFYIAKVAFNEAVKLKPSGRILLRDKARVILEHIPEQGHKNRFRMGI